MALGLRLRGPTLGLQVLLVVSAAAFGLVAGRQPELAIVAAIGLGLVALIAADLTVGLCAFTFIGFIDVVPGGPTFSLAKVIGLVLALSWLATIATRQDAKADIFGRHPIAVYALGLLVAWAAISALWAQDSGEAFTAASRYGLNFLLFPIVYTAVRERRHVSWLAWTFVAGALFSAAFGVVSPQPTQEGRLAGAIGEANELASVLVAAFAIAAGLAIASRRSPGTRLIAACAAVLCLGGVFFSLSRAGLVALLVVGLAAVLVSGRWRGRAAVATLLIAALAVSYFAAVADPEARERVTRIEGGTGRVDLWTIGWRMFEDRPLVGVGAGNYQISSPRYLIQPGAIVRDDFVLDQPKQTHNIYLQVLSELGLPGLLLFAAIIGFGLGCAVAAARAFRRRGDAWLEALTWSFLLAALGILAADFFQSEQFSKQLWMLLALGPALLGLSRRLPPDRT